MEIGRTFNDLATFRRGNTRPGRQCLTRGSDGAFSFLCRSKVSFANDVVQIGRISVFDFASSTNGDPFTADVIADINHEPEPPNQKSYRSGNRAGLLGKSPSRNRK